MGARLKVTVKVHDVQKGLPMKQGESVQDFSRALSEATQAAFISKFNIAKDKGNIWLCEIFQSSTIFEVCKYDASEPKDRYRIYAATYKRDEKTGAFTFGETKEVQRVVRYEAKDTITKSSGESLFKGLL